MLESREDLLEYRLAVIQHISRRVTTYITFYHLPESPFRSVEDCTLYVKDLIGNELYETIDMTETQWCHMINASVRQSRTYPYSVWHWLHDHIIKECFNENFSNL